MLNENQTLYDTLDISPDASPQEVRDAYFKTKATFNKDSLVLYTLISPEEREENLRKIEEAYQILSDPDKRRSYDQNHGLINASSNPFAGAEHQPEGPSNVVSIDRVPPMDNLLEGENYLVPPTTDFFKSNHVRPEPHTTVIRDSSLHHGASNPADNSHPAITQMESPMESPTPHPAHKLESTFLLLIEKEQEWKGAFLRQIREAYKISVEEMSGITKVSKTYIIAIEDENFAKLPAQVFIRGFVTQIAKVLKLPHEKVASAYLSRYPAPRNQ